MYLRYKPPKELLDSQRHLLWTQKAMIVLFSSIGLVKVRYHRNRGVVMTRVMARLVMMTAVTSRMTTLMSVVVMAKTVIKMGMVRLSVRLRTIQMSIRVVRSVIMTIGAPQVGKVLVMTMMIMTTTTTTMMVMMTRRRSLRKRI